MVEESKELCEKHGGKWDGKSDDCVFNGEIRSPHFFRVHYDEATNFGFRPVGIKFFKDVLSAEPYAKYLAESLKETEDMESVEIQDPTGEVVEAWRQEGDKVEHYPKGY